MYGLRKFDQNYLASSKYELLNDVSTYCSYTIDNIRKIRISNNRIIESMNRYDGCSGKTLFFYKSEIDRTKSCIRRRTKAVYL